MGLKQHPRHSKRVTRTKRWQAIRHAVLERCGWACVTCGARGRLEVDHILPVRTHPALSFDPANCQALCAPCHTRKTRLECGFPEPREDRRAWRQAVAELEGDQIPEEQAKEATHARFFEDHPAPV